MTPRDLPDYLPADWPDYAPIPSQEAWARAVDEDERVAAALAQAQNKERRPMSTPDSIRVGREMMASAKMTQAATRAALIEQGVLAPDGTLRLEFYDVDMCSLQQVCQVLGAQPGPSQHHFLTSKSTFLQETPIEGIRNGRLQQVLAAAASYAQR